MLKFLLRLFLVLVLGVIVSTQIVNRGADYLFESVTADYSYDAVRGQVYALRQALDPVAPADRERYLDTALRPHYGLALSLRDDGALALSAAERRQLAAGRFIMRDEYRTFIAPLAGTPAQWLEIRLPPDPPVVGWIFVVAYVMAIVLLGTILLVLWALPMWRDLDALRQASLRMAQGELDVRARISRFSALRHVSGAFNHMAERIAALVDNQRSLTHAVSHELRTPVARLTFELDMLRGESRPERRAALIEDMQNDVAELDAMVAELLVYARLERPQDGCAELQDVDVRDWLGEACAQLQRDAERRGVTLHADPGGPPRVRLEPRDMTRALGNLLRNALRHARAQVTVALEQDGQGAYVLTVDDDGAGIAPADRQRLFEPFIRLDESRDRETGGVGLGLAIVARVATCHQGSVHVEDSPLGGARFVLRWPGAVTLAGAS